MTRTLVIAAHPDMAHSRVNALWAQAVRDSGTIKLRDLYASYPDGQIDGAAERALLDAHDRIILQFPLTWYSCPPLLSHWQIAILKRGWAYGPGGRALRLKTFGIAFSTGSNGRDFQADGRYGRTLQEVTVPFELLAKHTGMHYLPPFTLTGVRELDDDVIAASAQDYIHHLGHAEPLIHASGKDDERARTVYPEDVPTG
ncbi:NAD(P)H-dependent oxidoreductase [Sulfitobacter pseudonitzschiae]|uniref:NAD(P)H-dependent oxidoreductase n=1 Tax=Pseudosulfitobacter pseudonitzschiae TaxID=1402135 RepID=A0A9Q2NN73_9RHOB|nr:NAD(P)H-dependent oxidoreductase [Pseudosulfitobacter pseudonitzschiae]MBM2294980.1 NAD(P)H-dependent oxidoreductase [Pseudosulfitobacter pseudonitzschiae]MBM2299895.1 NAD(P)H-dependent oxidoreductase [Pseudosulfitobacter pseudonitzschiae]MBM2304818.1 NAD(P)H-dependent oxidoreductase [Pseudosulfitobacter pseudonitzschiae]MBM2314591.1 NAD(P)H-dependent oxidoreductase [Pseudosulfitobacter pseudonitzschiae]MBM2319501.1 NAD(P)H-dependent oxidoreductase [Pseudosulfitobacter pseudonitzschiae]